MNLFYNYPVCGVRGRGNRIVGGIETAANEYPWIVGMSRQGKLTCGASLISHNFVMTAAHCVYGVDAKELRIYLGGHNITRDYTEQRRVRTIHRHELFDIYTYDNDIAILELDRAVQFGPKVQPGCLPDPTHAVYDGSTTVVAGWGRVGEGKPTSPVLRSLVMPVWSDEQCGESGYGRDRITANMMCAGYHDGQKDACQVSDFRCTLLSRTLINPSLFVVSNRATAAARCTWKASPAAWRSSVWSRGDVVAPAPICPVCTRES